jgi:hypothetical protein
MTVLGAGHGIPAFGERAGNARSFFASQRGTPATGTQATVPFNTLGYLFWAVVKHPVTVAAQ